MGGERGLPDDEKSPRALLANPVEAAFDVGRSPGLQGENRHVQCLGPGLEAFELGWTDIVVGFQRTTIRVADGATSLRNSRRFVTVPPWRSDSPVKFPPGRARLLASPTPTGSAFTVKTMGIAAPIFLRTLPA